ncbi:hypothetical protein [Halioxenophilus sp. WMMB6]|uniref:hypothetical protein n=1 Tax=Halioxenophilus sp. WMMB6 TaxID=3073815 RepID=UPI00295EFA50|nr:hypothetical protein [Halioxenophilus sp. WMMB6]
MYAFFVPAVVAVLPAGWPDEYSLVLYFDAIPLAIPLAARNLDALVKLIVVVDQTFCALLSTNGLSLVFTPYLILCTRTQMKQFLGNYERLLSI